MRIKYNWTYTISLGGGRYNLGKAHMIKSYLKKEVNLKIPFKEIEQVKNNLFEFIDNIVCGLVVEELSHFGLNTAHTV